MRLRLEVATLGALAAGAVVAVISSAKVLAAHPEMYGIDLVAYILGAILQFNGGTEMLRRPRSAPSLAPTLRSQE